MCLLTAQASGETEAGTVQPYGQQEGQTGQVAVNTHAYTIHCTVTSMLVLL